MNGAVLQVSRSTVGFIQRGHPWVRPDRFTVGLEGLRVGQVVTLVDDRGRGLASALVEPDGEVCARVFHRLPGKAFDPAAAIARAWARRAALHADPATDCYRVVHGEADYLPGLRVERYGDALVVVVFSACIQPYLDGVLAGLAAVAPSLRIVVKDHRDDLRRAAVATRWAAGGQPDPETIVTGRELGCTFPLRPLGGLATGLYVDQRATRSWLRPQVAGKRIVNLFAYTGAFSISLLAAGAASAVDVDLAAPALTRASEAAALNGLAERHRTVHSDCRRFLVDSTAQFDVAIVDPPTAAQGADGWIARRDYPALLDALLPRLAPQALVLLCSNTLGGKPLDVEALLADAARRQGRACTVVTPPALGEDLPALKGFPEGVPYRLAVMRL